jgi:hypothetical protein
MVHTMTRPLALLAVPNVETVPAMPWFYGPGGGATIFPDGETILTDTLRIDNQFGHRIAGQGQFRSTVRWRGPADKPVLSLASCDRGVIENLSIAFDTPASAAILLTRAKDSKVTNTNCTVRDVWIEGSEKCLDGVVIDNTAEGAPDYNGEHHAVYDCSIGSVTRNCVGVYSTQSHRCSVERVNMYLSACGVYAKYGSQTMRGCYGSALGLVFFGGGQYAGRGLVEDNNFENCNRFVDLRLMDTGAQWVIRGNRCDGMQTLDGGSNPGNPDTAAVFGHAMGSLIFADNQINATAGFTVPRIVVHYLQGLQFTNNWLGTRKPWLEMQTNKPAAWVRNRWGVDGNDDQEIKAPK